MVSFYSKLPQIHIRVFNTWWIFKVWKLAPIMDRIPKMKMIMQWKLQTNSCKVFGMTKTIFCYFLQCTDIALIIKCDFQNDK